MERYLADFLAEHSRGRTNLQGTKLLQEAMKATEKHGKASEVTLKIKITPSKGMSLISVGVTSKLPTEEPDQFLYFTDEDGNPCAENPRQMSLPLRRAEDEL